MTVQTSKPAAKSAARAAAAQAVKAKIARAHTAVAEKGTALQAKPAVPTKVVKAAKPTAAPAPTKAALPPVAAKAEPVAKLAPKAKVKVDRKPNVASVAKALILAGKTNEDVFAVLHKQFSLSEDKKHYPGWYRAALVREEKKQNGAKAADALKVKLAATAHAKT